MREILEIQEASYDSPVRGVQIHGAYVVEFTFGIQNESSSKNDRVKPVNPTTENAISKVPEVTLIFWIIKIAATTLGETAGDAVSMSMNLGYLVGTAIFAAIFLAAVGIQIKAKRFHPFIYWTTIVATTTVGRFCRPFTRYRLQRWRFNSVRSSRGIFSHLVLVARRCFCC